MFQTANLIGIGIISSTGEAPNPFGITTSIASTGSEAVNVALASDESTAVTVSGSVTTGDIVAVNVLNANLSGGQKTIQYTTVGGDTTTTIATALKNAINADTALQAVGVQATSAANVLTINPYTYFTGSSSGTETVSVSNANRGSAAITIGGTVTTGNTVTISSHNPTLAGGVKNSVYTVVSGDTLATIAKGLAAAINADTSLQAIGTKVANSASLAWSQSFTGNAILPSGSSSAAVSAVDGSSTNKTNGYALSVNDGSTTNLTFDLNGNMTSDGTNAFAWDAENRMIKITYPGTNNFSTFVYDGLSRNVSIVETTAGSVTSTKQFVWCGDDGRCEERDASGALTKKFFQHGQINSTTKYLYDLDHLGSVREVTDNSGIVQAQYGYSPHGQLTKIIETVSPDFTYARYYSHSRSSLNLTTFRNYFPNLGRWINRDPAGETGGDNLEVYARNNPVSYVDPLGLEECPCDELNPFLQGSLNSSRGVANVFDFGIGDSLLGYAPAQGVNTSSVQYTTAPVAAVLTGAGRYGYAGSAIALPSVLGIDPLTATLREAMIVSAGRNSLKQFFRFNICPTYELKSIRYILRKYSSNPLEIIRAAQRTNPQYTGSTTWGAVGGVYAIGK